VALTRAIDVFCVWLCGWLSGSG